MTKITFLMLHLNYGGIEKQVTTLANNLSKDKNYEISIVSVYDILGKSFYPLNSNIKVKYLINYGPDLNKLKDSFKNFKIKDSFKELTKSTKLLYSKYILMKKEIDNLDTDIIVSSRIEFNKLITRTDTYNIAQEHSYITDDKYLKDFKKSFKNMNKLIVMTNKAKDLYSRYVDKDKISVVGNMIEEKDGLNYDIISRQIIACGRLEKIKRYDLLIDIYNEFNKICKGFKLKIIGDGSERENLLNKIKEYNLQDNITLAGVLDDKKLEQEYKKSSIFCHTASSESFSLVLGEAMSFSLPCMSFAIDARTKRNYKKWI